VLTGHREVCFRRDETGYRCRMLEVRRMTSARDDVDPRTGEALRELVRVY
jgi:hypothetical protein